MTTRMKPFLRLLTTEEAYAEIARTGALETETIGARSALGRRVAERRAPARRRGGRGARALLFKVARARSRGRARAPAALPVCSDRSAPRA